jgi:mannitol-1-phosphate 5-dehydrogenase
MRTLIIWGAGRIGRGFVAGLFHEPLWRIVFVDIDRALVDGLNRAGGYTVFRARKEGVEKTRLEGGFSALHTGETEALSRLFREEGLMLDIAVHEPKLPEVADMLAPLFAARARSGAGPMDVMMNVNMARPDAYFRTLMGERLSPAALKYFIDKVGVTGIFAMCISPLAPDWLKKEDPLALWNNGWETQTVSRKELKCPPPKAPRLLLTDDIEREETRKLYTLNMAHALLSYLGLPRGLKTSLEAVKDPELRRILDGALIESSAGLEYEFGFGEEEMAAWRDKISSVLESPYIEDGLQRLGADTRRKLSARDRLVGPAGLCLKAGKEPVNLIKAIRAGFGYENPDEGTREVREFYQTHGLAASVQKYCAITPLDGLYGRIVSV